MAHADMAITHADVEYTGSRVMTWHWGKFSWHLAMHNANVAVTWQDSWSHGTV